MKNVATIFNRKARLATKPITREWPLPEQLMGIEVEIDPSYGMRNVKLPDNVLPYWRRERDGSLRNGYEYVLASPFSGNILSAAIAQLFSDDPTMERTATGSTHIHIDMLEDNTSVSVIPVLTMLMFVLEPAVFAAADPGREWCGYTNRLASAPDVLIGSVLNGDLETDASALVDLVSGHTAGAVGRYYGLNLQALQKYGSIEFRYFPTATTVDELASWVRMVQLFKKAAMDLGSLQHIEHVVKDEDAYKQFIDSYFKEWADIFLITVPQHVALRNYYKARAVADAWRVRGDSAFDPAAVTSNKVFAKFLKKKTRKTEESLSEGTSFFPVHGLALEEVGRFTPVTRGAVLVSQGAIYVGLSDITGSLRWENIADGYQRIIQERLARTLSPSELDRLYRTVLQLPESNEFSTAPTATAKQNTLRAINRALYGEASTSSPAAYDTFAAAGILADDSILSAAAASWSYFEPVDPVDLEAPTPEEGEHE